MQARGSPYRTSPWPLPEPTIVAADPTRPIALAMVAFGGIRLAVAVASAELCGGEVGLAYSLVMGAAYLWFGQRRPRAAMRRGSAIVSTCSQP